MESKLLLYDTFNAKYLSFQEVAESFVTNDEFVQLNNNSSILLMGSRGCGKTTLLKMLTPAGQHFWKCIDLKNEIEKLSFTAIYVPSDIQWKNQFDYLNKYLLDQKELIEIITQFLFAANVQIALCKTFKSVIDFGNYNLNEKNNFEYEVCISLAKVWQIKDNILPTFDEIELCILQRVRFVNSLVKNLIFSKYFEGIKEEIPKYVFDDFFDLVKLGCKVFEQKVDLKNDHKWALCFDELEIVPKFIQLKLINFLRSVDQKYIFKLTTTPLFNLENTVIEASQGNDFSDIKLWVYDESGLQRWRKFCDKLIRSRFEKKYKFENIDIKLIFGEYNLDEIIKDEFNEIKPQNKLKFEFNNEFKPGLGVGSSMNLLYKHLASIDDSFKTFLEKRKIDPDDPYTEDIILQKSVFLKYKVDAIYRLIYRKRTRRTPPIHFGIPYIYDLCDGNPRLVIGLIDEILQKSKENLTENKPISKYEQSKIIYNASEKYFNLLKNHPDSTITFNNADFNLATDLLLKIGRYMNDKIIQSEFSKSSPSTFIIDEDINHRFLGLLETALYLGAIIYLDPIESLSNTGIIGKRFRLSSFLNPKFKIPGRILSEVKLSTILKIENDKQQMKFKYFEDDKN